MKCMITLIYIMYIMIYIYSAHMTSVDPENTLWGYICTFVFGFLSVWSINLFTKYSLEKEKNPEES